MNSAEVPIRSITILILTLADVTFEKSCLDMGWNFEVECVDDANEELGWILRCSFRRPDRDTGEVSTGYGRPWLIDYGATESSVVKTAWVAAKMIVEHELHEAFKYRGKRVFDPHRTIDELTGVARR